MSCKILVLSSLLFAAASAGSQPDKRSVLSGWEPLAWPAPPAWPQPHGGNDLTAEVAGAVAAAKAAAAAVMSAQNDVAAAKHAALEQQSAASAKGVEAARAAHKSEEASRWARAHALEAAQAAVQAQAQLAAARARAAVAQKVAAAREAAAAKAIQRAAHNQAARLQNAVFVVMVAALLFEIPLEGTRIPGDAVIVPTLAGQCGSGLVSQADIEALKLSVIQSTGAAGAAGAAHHAATAAAAALRPSPLDWPKLAPWTPAGPWAWS